MKRAYFIFMLVGVLFLNACITNKQRPKDTDILSESPYLGQKLPGSTPKLFAPSFVNTNAIEINTVYNTTYTELFLQGLLIVVL